jgi:hypothetical protein
MTRFHTQQTAGGQVVAGSNPVSPTCQPDSVFLGQKPCLSVTETHHTGALDSVSPPARNHRIFPRREIGPDQGVSPSI